MTDVTRRMAVLGGAASALTAPAHAQAAPQPFRLATHPAYAAWTPPSGRALDLEKQVDIGDRRRITLREWFGGRPGVLALWATWCTPCLREKPYQSSLDQRLESSGARARIFALQIYDSQTLEQGRNLLSIMGAAHLATARVTTASENEMRRQLRSHAEGVRADRSALPACFLIDANGAELGRSIGWMLGPDGRTGYWMDRSTFDFLSRL